MEGGGGLVWTGQRMLVGTPKRQGTEGLVPRRAQWRGHENPGGRRGWGPAPGRCSWGLSKPRASALPLPHPVTDPALRPPLSGSLLAEIRSEIPSLSAASAAVSLSPQLQGDLSPKCHAFHARFSLRDLPPPHLEEFTGVLELPEPQAFPPRPPGMGCQRPTCLRDSAAWSQPHATW